MWLDCTTCTGRQRGNVTTHPAAVRVVVVVPRIFKARSAAGTVARGRPHLPPARAATTGDDVIHCEGCLEKQYGEIAGPETGGAVHAYYTVSPHSG